MPFILDSPSPSPSPPPQALQDAEIRRREHHSAEVVVVGAGVLGSALAITLARQGRSVLLLEQSLKEPDRIVGELLQPGGVEALEKLGLRQCLEDIDAIVVQGYQVIYHGQDVHIPYPANAVSNGKRAEGRSFHHGRFIRRLREAALKEPNITVVETKVTGVVRSNYTSEILGVQSLTRGERDYYFASLTFIADGYDSKFRKEFVPYSPVVKSKFYGLELKDADLPRPLHGHVVLSDEAPVLLYQIGTHETRILVDVPNGLPSASVANGGVKGHLRSKVLPSLPKSIQPSFEAALDEGKLKSMPNSWLPPSANKNPGLIIIGDAMNMRHPLTGGGMTVALNDVVLLRTLLGPDAVPDLSDTKLVRRQMQSFHWRRKNLTSVINILAQALYQLFAANDVRLRALQLGCFRYFQLGGQCVDGPVGLLAGIIRQPFVLFYHFFAVALLAMWLLFKASPLWQLPLTLTRMFLVFWTACVVIFPYIGSEDTKDAKWIKQVKITYQDPLGKTSVWESAERTTRPANAKIDGVGVVAILQAPSGPEILLQKQFRPPVGKVCIEIPAGLLDAGETAAQCAVRELKEETGYVGEAVEEDDAQLGVMFNDPGFTNTNLQLVYVTVDPGRPENQKENLQAEPEEHEFITTFSVPLKDLWGEFRKLEAQGYAIDARVGTIAEGIRLALKWGLKG